MKLLFSFSGLNCDWLFPFEIIICLRKVYGLPLLDAFCGWILVSVWCFDGWKFCLLEQRVFKASNSKLSYVLFVHVTSFIIHEV